MEYQSENIDMLDVFVNLVLKPIKINSKIMDIVTKNVQTHIPSKVKKEAEEVFSKFVLQVSQVMKTLYFQAAQKKHSF